MELVEQLLSWMIRIMIQKLAWIFGAVFVLVGVLGFVPALTPDGYLLGIFEVDTLHNVIHLLSGILALGAAWTGAYARLYFQVFGVVYGAVTVVGFLQGDTVLGLFTVNVADHFLHFAIAAAALYAGFMMKEGAVANAM
jgi:hypothetical protein